MGERSTQHQTQEVRLQAEAEQLLAELRAKLDELDRIRGRGGLVTPEQRRRTFKVISGGAAVAVAVTVWQTIKRPQVAAASLAGAAGLVAVPVAIDPPPMAPAYPSTPPTIIEWREERIPPPEQSGGDEIRVQAARDELEPEPAPVPEPEPEPPEPVRTPAPEPEPEPQPEPVKAPTATVTVTAEPTLEPTQPVELDVEVNNGACLDAQLVGVDLGACVGK